MLVTQQTVVFYSSVESWKNAKKSEKADTWIDEKQICLCVQAR